MTTPQEFPSIKKGTYRHTKNGHHYEVLDVAIQTETNEPLVIYRPLYETDHSLFARPYDMFVETVAINGVTAKRFEKVDE